MMQIEQWFPIHIGYVHNPFHKEIEDELTQRCLEVKELLREDFEKGVKEDTNNTNSSPLTTWYNFQARSSYEILKDQKFSRLHNWIDDQVGEFTEKFHNFRNAICKNRIIAIEELFENRHFIGYRCRWWNICYDD